MPQQTDLAALARQFGGQSASGTPSPSVDYAALAQDYGGQQEDEGSGWLPTALRVGGGVVGSVGGGLVGSIVPGAGTAGGAMAGGALGSGIGEYLAQQIEKSHGEREDTSLARVGIQTAIGGIPGVGVGKTVLGTFGRSALQGGALGAGEVTAEALLERGELPTAGEFATGAGGGALFGGPLGAALHGGQRLVTGLRRRDAPTARPAGELPPGSFTAGPDGRVAAPGHTIDMQPGPDGSFVRAEPGQWARREPRGLLPAGPRFVADAEGQVAPLEQADALVPRAPASRADDASVRGVPAAVVGREIDGGKVTRKVFSGDPDAADAPLFSAEVRDELERMREEMSVFTPQRGGLNYGVPGGNRSHLPGGEQHYVERTPAAPVAEDIRVVADSRAGHQAIAEAIDNLLAGKPVNNKLAFAAIETAQARREGRSGFSRPVLPDDWRTMASKGGERPPVSDDVPAFFDEIEAGPPGSEAGEAGFIATALVPKLGGAAAGAAIGGATGDSTEDRTSRALLGAGAGFAGGAAAVRALSRQGPRVIDGLIPRQQATTGPRPIAGDFLRPRGAAGQGEPIRNPLQGFEPFISKFSNPLVREGVRERLAAHGGFAEQRRGVVSNQQTARLAERVAVDVSRTLPRGTALNAEQVTAYARAVDRTMGEVQRLAGRVNSGAATDADVLALRVAEADHAVVLASMVGARAEAGRALQAYRAFSGALASGDVNLIRAATRGGREDAEQLARRLTEAGTDPLARYDVLRQSAATSTWDEVRSFWYANLLSGVKTHERNFIGNMANAISNLAIHPVAAGVDAVRSRATGRPRTLTLGELPHQVVGTFAGVERGLRDFAFTLRHGVSPDNLSRTIARAEQQGQFDAARVDLAGGGANPLNYPGRLLDATDTLFRSINRHAELYGLAYTRARSEGLTGRRLEERMADLIAGTARDAGELHQQAATVAQRAVFQEALGPRMAKFQAWARSVPGLEFVIPFIRTPANILKQGLEFSPAGALMQGAKQDGRAGSQAQARVAAGTAAAGVLAWLAATNRLTGSGPRDPAERAAWMESGARPNSVRVGDTWVSYQLFQPVSVQASIVANAFEAWQANREDGAASAAVSTVFRSIDSFLDQSFLSGLFDIVQAVSRGEVNQEGALRTVGRTAHSLTPLAGLQRTVRDAVDPVQRKPETPGEAFAVNVPGMSDSVRPRVDRFGEVVTREGGPARRALDPFNTSSVVNDPVAREMDRLGVRLNIPRDAMTRRGERVELTSQQEVALQQMKGRAIRFALERVIASPAYQRLSDERRAERLERAIQTANQRASRNAPRQLGIDVRQAR